MQIYNLSNSLPVSNRQQFKGAKFFKVPNELEKVILKDANFDYLAKHYDVNVTALPKATWKDPFRLRTPKTNEKSYLSCEITRPNNIYAHKKLNVATNNNLLAPLQEHVESFLVLIKDLTMKDRFDKYIL